MTGYDDNNYAGRQRSIQIDDLTLTTKGGVFDIFNSNALIDMKIFESVFENCTSGSISVLDNGGFFERLKISGDETLSVRFKSAQEFPGPFYTKTFSVYKCDAINSVNGSKTRIFQLLFASPAFMTNMEIRIRRSWKDTKENAIADNVVKRILKAPNVRTEATRYPRNIVVPGWRPFHLLNYLCSSSVRGSGYPASNYVFYEDRDKYNFVSLDLLITGGPKHDLDFHVSRSSDPRDLHKLWNAKDYRIASTFDAIKASREGVWAQKFIAQDMFRKKVKEFEYDYAAEFGAQKHVEDGGAKLRDKFSSSTDQSVLYGPWDKGSNSEHSDDWMRRRRPMMESFGGYAVEADTEGNTNVLVGDKIRFNLYTNTPDSEELDKRMSGNYLVTRILHIIDNKEHRSTVELRKDALVS